MSAVLPARAFRGAGIPEPKRRLPASAAFFSGTTQRKWKRMRLTSEWTATLWHTRSNGADWALPFGSASTHGMLSFSVSTLRPKRFASLARCLTAAKIPRASFMCMSSPNTKGALHSSCHRCGKRPASGSAGKDGSSSASPTTSPSNTGKTLRRSARRPPPPGPGPAAGGCRHHACENATDRTSSADQSPCTTT